MSHRHALAALPLLLLAAGCSQPADTAREAAERTRAANLRVLREDEMLARDRERLPPGATPSQLAWSVGVYCDGLGRIEMADCPADFRVAYRQHARAWRDLRTALAQLPDNFLEGVFMGAVNGLLRGERDGGAGRLEGDLKRAIERTRATWEEVERVGAKYGAAL